MDDNSDLVARTRGSGQVIFVLGGLVLVALLLSQIGSQTTWSERARSFAAQPRLWPVVALVMMGLGFAFHLFRLKRRWPNGLDLSEAARWCEPLEYTLWFMAYVFTVPILGFLPMSLAFATALAWRLGYRTRRWLWTAAGFAVAVVVLFKGFLSVSIPGGAIYQYLPDAIRSFFLVYL